MGGKQLTFGWAFIGNVEVSFDSESWIRGVESSDILETQLCGGSHSPCGAEKA